jgi:hypothetical protein
VRLSASFEKNISGLLRESFRAARHAADGELLGAHLIGPEVTELVPKLALRPRRKG